MEQRYLIKGEILQSLNIWPYETHDWTQVRYKKREFVHFKKKYDTIK